MNLQRLLAFCQRWFLTNHHFGVRVAATTTIAGHYNANAGLDRFAATGRVAPAMKEKAIAWVSPRSAPVRSSRPAAGPG